MEASTFNWERLDIKRSKDSTNFGKKSVIWLTKPKANQRPNTMNIAADLVEKAGLREGDTIWLYKNGGMFMLRKEPSDFALRSQGAKKRTLILRSVDFVAHLGYHKNGLVFDAWVDDGNIIFKPKEDNSIGS